MKTVEQPFAVFAVVMEQARVWAITCYGADRGRICLPGGKVGPHDDPLDAVVRKSRQQGLVLLSRGRFVRQNYIDSKLIFWYAFEAAHPMEVYKEQHRGIDPILVSPAVVAAFGCGNGFLLDFPK